MKFTNTQLFMLMLMVILNCGFLTLAHFMMPLRFDLLSLFRVFGSLMLTFMLVVLFRLVIDGFKPIWNWLKG